MLHATSRHSRIVICLHFRLNYWIWFLYSPEDFLICKFDLPMVMLVEFNTNIIEIGPPGLILWGKYNLMAAILENGRQWPPYWNFQVANAFFLNSRPKVTCMPNLVLVSQSERFP
jgi:hypothetical protein